MNNIVNKYILADSGFWYAIYSKDDQYHEDAKNLHEFVFNHKIIIPWPIHYEVLRTKFVKNNIKLALFEKDIKKPNVEIINDEPYRLESLRNLFDGKAKNIKYENLSLTDIILNKIILDKRIKINYMITFNKKDFEFSCNKRRIEIYPK